MSTKFVAGSYGCWISQIVLLWDPLDVGSCIQAMSWDPRDSGSCQAVLPSDPVDLGSCFFFCHGTCLPPTGFIYEGVKTSFDPAKMTRFIFEVFPY